MAGNHATGTAGILGTSELNRDTAGLQGTYGWAVQSGAVTFSTGLTFNVAAIATADYKVAGVNGASYAGGSVVLTTQDATNPRVDIIVVTVAGAVSAVAGTPAALTSTGGPGPATPSAAQLEIARIFVPASGGLLSALSITDRRVALPDGAVTLTTTGDIIYASAAHTPARLGAGSAYQMLAMNSGATLPTYQASPTSALTTTGDVLYASAPNTLARLGIGTAYQALGTNAGATAPSWQASSKSVLTTTGDVMYASAANTPVRLGIGSASQVFTVAGGVPTWAASATPTYKYMTATQVFTTTTTFADVVTTGSTTMSFAIAASEVWKVTYRLPLSFGGTGGVKFQLTGPASPTAVTLGVLQSSMTLETDTVFQVMAAARSTDVTAFSTAFAARNSSAGTVSSTYANSANPYTLNNTVSWIEITAFIANGANAGTVTLQAAQNSSNSTTTLGIGSHMRADKVA